MARYWCDRCRQECNTLSDLHICADIARRYARREKQRQAVIDELSATTLDEESVDILASNIVQRLANMGVEED